MLGPALDPIGGVRSLKLIATDAPFFLSAGSFRNQYEPVASHLSLVVWEPAVLYPGLFLTLFYHKIFPDLSAENLDRILTWCVLLSRRRVEIFQRVFP